ncbi:DUF3396 domain-containing protein [Xenorhabdus sp. M]|uniref:DUF3396 domain-containing protein n=1 Tax=Xenorhabdus szentirmaii TaxID=290112 RepID=A0AAW3YUN0_9GAMM|nr:type VI immunity family protein [Xenorhabdus sp. M]MBD2801705.1 DUF3396 domain-containing protein [Xenorhabdus sp. M]
MDFFEKFKQAEWEFTYGAEDDPEKHNALQVGLVAYFYIDQGYLPENRQRMAEAFALYHREFGDKLKWGFFHDPEDPEYYHDITLEQHCHRITEGDADDMDCFWGEEEGYRYSSNYKIEMGSPAGWFECIHGSVSYLSFYLPLSELKTKGVIYLENLLREFCTILKPMHGLAGLGIQQSFARYRYQHLEYEIVQEFLGIDVANVNDDDCYRNGIRSINWYTFFQDEWLNKLGGMEKLSTDLGDKHIHIMKYEGGVIVRAGDWPELGWKKETPYPESYVKVNNVLKPIRAPEINNLSYGTTAGETRFDKTSTAQWLKRFDVELPLDTAEQKKNHVQ